MTPEICLRANDVVCQTMFQHLAVTRTVQHLLQSTVSWGISSEQDPTSIDPDMDSVGVLEGIRIRQKSESLLLPSGIKNGVQ